MSGESFSKGDFDTSSNPKTNDKSIKKKKVNKKREQHLIVMDLFLALILCHNVTPVYTAKADDASS